MDDYFDLGAYSRPISTTSVEAQRWFDRGLIWSYGFNHAEALHCFEKVVQYDPDCAMGYWGIAYAIGPYYNLAWREYSENGRKTALHQTYTLAREAQKRAAGATAVEQAIIEALVVRFPRAIDVEDEAEYGRWDDAYAAAMRQVYAQFPDDDDVCALTAEALMCRTPWLLWDLLNRVPAAGADTSEALAIVEKAIQRIAEQDRIPHPGLLHFYLHLLEMSPEPEKALAACDTLFNLVPDSGHLVHMPSHIYILCGLYDKALAANMQPWPIINLWPMTILWAYTLFIVCTTFIFKSMRPSFWVNTKLPYGRLKKLLLPFPLKLYITNMTTW